jgi:molybdate transport system permease protein
MLANRYFNWFLYLPLSALTVFLLGLFAAQVPFFPHNRFTEILTQPEILHAIRLSLLAATLSSVLAMLVALPCAYLLSRKRFPGSRVLDTLLDLPLVLTPVALGTLLLMLFNTRGGTLIQSFGVQVPFAVAGVVLAQFTVVIAIAVRMLKATFDDINPRYEKVARTLGCNEAGAFFRVTLPLARNGILAALILTWARALAEFGATATLAGTALGKTATLPAAIYLAISAADLERAVALIMLLTGIALLLLLLLRLVGSRRAV